MPLIVMFVLISIIAIIYVGAPFGRPSETAELNKNIDKSEEQISAATATTVNAGDTYTVPQDGIYKIELHGGHGAGEALGGQGSKVTGYIRLSKNNALTCGNIAGGEGYKQSGTYLSGPGGDGISISLGSDTLMAAGGGGGYGRYTGNGKCAVNCGFSGSSMNWSAEQR